MSHAIPTTMQALRVHDFAGLAHWRLETVDTPQPGPEELLIQVAASGISYVDLLLARGGYQVKPPLPLTPGTEFSGTVVATGAALARDWALGQAVAGTAFGGTWAQYVLVSPQAVVPLASGAELALAADLGITGATAVHALHDRARLQAGETVLVLGAAGGVGLAAVQVAKAIGARVIASASRADKRELARHMGADATLDSRSATWREDLREIAATGVDVVVDTVGGGLTEPAFRSLAWNGRHLVIGFAGGDIPNLRTNLALLKGASLMGVDIRQFPLKEPLAAVNNLKRTGDYFQRAQLRPHLAARYPFAQWSAAVTMAQDPLTLGKVVMLW